MLFRVITQKPLDFKKPFPIDNRNVLSSSKEVKRRRFLVTPNRATETNIIHASDNETQAKDLILVSDTTSVRKLLSTRHCS
jgi:hypothetical protein